MAFSNIRSVSLGGGLRFVLGDYTQSVGGGSQTFALGGGRVLMCAVNPQVSGEPVDAESGLYSVSTSNGIVTMTIYGNSAVTAGSFCVLVDAGS